MSKDHLGENPKRPLDGFDWWLVDRNLEYVKTEGLAPVVARLRANGYLRVATAVEYEHAKLTNG